MLKWAKLIKPAIDYDTSQMMPNSKHAIFTLQSSSHQFIQVKPLEITNISCSNYQGMIMNQIQNSNQEASIDNSLIRNLMSVQLLEGFLKFKWFELLNMHLNYQVLQSVCRIFREDEASRLVCVVDLIQKNKILLQADLNNHNQCDLQQDARTLLWIDNSIETLLLLQVHGFNQINLSRVPQVDKHLEPILDRIGSNPSVANLLFHLIAISAFGKGFTRCASNAIYLLNASNYSFNETCLVGIKLEETDISGGNFARANLSYSTFRSVNINGCDFTGANLANSQWIGLEQSLLMTFSGCAYKTTTLDLSKDAKFQLSGSAEGIPQVWSTQRGKALFTLPPQVGRINQVAFAQHHLICATSCEDRKIKLWSLANKKIVRNLGGQKHSISRLLFSPSGKLLFYGTEGSSISVFNVASGKLIKKWLATTLNHGVAAMTISPDEEVLASGGSECAIQLWNLKSSKAMPAYQGHKKAVTSLAFSKCSNYLASGSQDFTVRVWDIRGNKLFKLLTGHTSEVLQVAFSADSEILASGGKDAQILIWGLQSNHETRRLVGHSEAISALCFATSHRYLASASLDSTLFLWDLGLRERMQRQGHQATVESIAFSPDGARLATGSGDNTIRLWDIKSAKEQIVLKGHSGAIKAITFIKGEKLASGSRDQTIRLWDLQTRVELKRIFGFLQYGIFSHDGEFMVSECCFLIRLWDISGGMLLGVLQGSKSAISSLAIAQDKKKVASGNEAGNIQIWDVESKQSCMQLKSKNQAIISIAFQLKDQRMVSASKNFVIQTWNLLKGSLMHVLKERVLPQVLSSDFSLRPLHVAGYQNGTIKVFMGTESSQVLGHFGQVTSMAFSSSESLLASGGVDSCIRIWYVRQCPKKAAVRKKCQNMSQSEAPAELCLVQTIGVPRLATFASANIDGSEIKWRYSQGELPYLVK